MYGEGCFVYSVLLIVRFVSSFVRVLFCVCIIYSVYGVWCVEYYVMWIARCEMCTVECVLCFVF